MPLATSATALMADTVIDVPDNEDNAGEPSTVVRQLFPPQQQSTQPEQEVDMAEIEDNKDGEDKGVWQEDEWQPGDPGIVPGPHSAVASAG